MNCKHPTLYVLGPENKPAPYGYCMLCEVARLTGDIATLERRERSRNNRIAELEDDLPALDARKEWDVRWRCSGCEQEIDPTTCGCGSPITHEAWGAGHAPIPMGCDCYRERSPASRDGRQGELSRLIERTVFDAYREGYMQGNEVSVRYEYEIRVAHAEGRACAYYDARRERLERAFAPAAAAEGDTHNQD